MLPPPPRDLATPASYCHNYHPPFIPLVSPIRIAKQLHRSTNIEPTGLDIRFLGLIPPSPRDLAPPASYCHSYHPPLTPLVSLMCTAKQLHPSTNIGPTGLDTWLLGLIPPPPLDLASQTHQSPNHHLNLTPYVTATHSACQFHPTSDIVHADPISGFRGRDPIPRLILPYAPPCP